MKHASSILAAIALGLVVSSACKDDDDHDGNTSGSPDQVGAVCEEALDCYPDVDHADLSGPAQCLTRVRGGYCTHECTDDADCCAVEGECLTDLPQVCSPFESTGQMMCFLSCEPADVAAAGADDEQAFCQQEASPDFICRASGGGDPHKVCVPGDCGIGAGCADTADCDPDLECLTYIRGGYCGTRGCQANADCPADSFCVAHGDGNYCARACAAETDCAFCRHPDVHGACSSDVTFAEAGTTATVCIVAD